MTQLGQDEEEIQSLVVSAAAYVKPVRGPRRAWWKGAMLCFILGLSAIAYYTAVKLGPRADFVISKEEEQHQLDVSGDHHHSFCSMTGQPPADRAKDMLELAHRANLNDPSSLSIPSTTCLNQTAAAFSRQSARILDTTTSNYLIGVTFEFQAMDPAGDPVTVGGDEFVLSVQAWPSGWSIKTAIYATDLDHGVYQVTVILPKVRVEHVNITLMHYYTNYEGFRYTSVQGQSYKGISRDLDHGPLRIELPQNVLDYLLTLPNKESLQPLLDARPLCQATQEGVDQLMAGVWIEEKIPLYGELTLNAKWEPFCCRPPVDGKPNNVNFFRIGSSTMPIPSLHVGDVYDLERPFHQRWVDSLLNTLPLATVNDTVVFSAGLHQLLYGYNPETAVEIIKRMICQIAAVFPGKMIFLGPCPIQQQLFPKIDMTDQHVLLLNALLRKEILGEHSSRLDSFCSHVDLPTLVSYPDTETGSLLDSNRTQSASKRQRKSIPESESELALVDKLRSKTEYGNNRTIYFAEIHDFMRPRPETYRDGDKVHDLRQFDNGMLFFGAHSKVIEHVLILRSLGDF